MSPATKRYVRLATATNHQSVKRSPKKNATTNRKMSVRKSPRRCVTRKQSPSARFDISSRDWVRGHLCADCAEGVLQECSQARVPLRASQEGSQVRRAGYKLSQSYLCIVFSKPIEECKVNEFYEHLRYETKYHTMCEKVPKSVCHTEYHKACEHHKTYGGEEVEKCHQTPKEGNYNVK